VAFDVLLNMSELTPYLRERLEEAKRALAKQKDWYSELASNDLVQINGLVSLSYPHGCSVTELDEWSVIFTFDAWTDASGVFHNEKLVVRKVVKQEESDRIKELVLPRDIITISCHIGLVGSSIISTEVSDDLLLNYRNELDTPVILKNDTFGKLTLDRSVNWFEGDVRMGLRKIRVSIEPKSVSDVDSAISIAEGVWANRKILIESAKEQATTELLDDKNDSWLNDGESPVTADKFKKRMKLTSIIIREEGGYDFWFSDGGLFWAHDIEVIGDDAKGFYQAGIQG